MDDWSTAARDAQASYYALLATGAPARAFAVGSGYGVMTGICSNTENGVVASAASPGDVETAIGRFQALDVPAMWLCASPELTELLLDAGCRSDRGGVDMGAGLRSLRLPEPSGDIAIVPAVDEPGLGRVLDVMRSGGLLETASDRRAAERLFPSLGLGGDRPLVHYLALRGQRPIGMATAFFTERTVLLQHVVVSEAERRRGVGRALAVARLREALRRDCTTAVLGPTPESSAIYRPLGFTTTPVGRDNVFYLPLQPAGA
jgi:GNAT superfamily N-acetyltransferase